MRRSRTPRDRSGRPRRRPLGRLETGRCSATTAFAEQDQLDAWYPRSEHSPHRHGQRHVVEAPRQDRQLARRHRRKELVLDVVEHVARDERFRRTKTLAVRDRHQGAVYKSAARLISRSPGPKVHGMCPHFVRPTMVFVTLLVLLYFTPIAGTEAAEG